MQTDYKQRQIYKKNGKLKTKKPCNYKEKEAKFTKNK